MNYFDDEQTEETDFKDVPDEVEGKEPPRPNVQVQKPAPPPLLPIPQSADQVIESDQDYEEGAQEDSEEPEDFTNVLSDARLRLEQGRLYEMIMNHDLFQGMDADPKAIKHVQKQIRNFAKEQMEIMLGMRQEALKEAVNAFPMELFPFNSMEVEVLKMLASTATNGESKNAEPIGPQPPPPKKTFTPISNQSTGRPKTTPAPVKKSLAKQPMSPMRRKGVDARVQQILAEEGLTMDEINEVFPPDHVPLDPRKLTEDQIIERNRNIRNRRATNPNTAPFPTAEQMEAAIIQRSQIAESTKPGWRELMGMVKAMPIKSE